MDDQNINSEDIIEQRVIQKPIKFCKHCGNQIDKEAVVCIHCGLQVEELKLAPQQVAHYRINPRNKWVALLLCVFLGLLGIHKFYEGKILLGVVYIIANALFITPILVVIDFIIILFKPNPYYV